MGLKASGLRGSLRNVSATVIPDSGVARFDFEDGDTTTAVDSWYDNTLTLDSPSYTSTAAVGSFALDHDGTDDNAKGDQTVDIAANGVTDEFTLAAHVQIPATESNKNMFGWQANVTDVPGVLMTAGSNGNWTILVRSGGSNEFVDTGVSQSTGSFVHLGITVSGSTVRGYVAGTREVETTTSNDPTTAGADGQFVTGSTIDDVNHSDAIVDAFEIHDERKSDSYLSGLAAES